MGWWRNQFSLPKSLSTKKGCRHNCWQCLFKMNNEPGCGPLDQMCRLHPHICTELSKNALKTKNQLVETKPDHFLHWIMNKWLEGTWTWSEDEKRHLIGYVAWYSPILTGADPNSWTHTSLAHLLLFIQPKRGQRDELTSLAMSLEALAAFIEMASGLRS